MCPSKLSKRCQSTANLFTLSNEHVKLKEMCRAFADKELKPIAGKLDNESKFPEEQIKKLGELGLMGITVEQQYNGAGLDLLATCIAVEELARGCASTGIIVSIHNCLYADILQRRGTERQKLRFLAPYTQGTIGAFALSEHEAGSDVANLATTARRDGDSFIINGSKAWVTSGYEAKSAIIFATVDKQLKHKGISAFIVPLNTDGVSLGKRESKMGIRASSTCDILLDNVRVSEDAVLGKIGEGFTVAMQQLQSARIGVAAQALGIAQASLDLAVNYSNNRILYGNKLFQLQLIKAKIAEMATRLEASRLLTWKAAYTRDTGQDFRKISSMAKYSASKCATANAHDCVQILGGMGYVTDMPAERHYRDARITQIYGGVTEVQQLIIAEQVSEEFIKGNM